MRRGADGGDGVRRALRILRRVAIVLSGMLFVASVVLWVRSYGRPDFMIARGHLLVADRGWVWIHGGAGYDARGAVFVNTSANVYRFPIWLLSPSICPPLLWLALFYRSRKRPAPGLCPACGYDLRATPDRCPECGAVAGA